MSDKAAVLKELESEYENFKKAIEGLDDAQLTRIWFGDWGVKDIVAHVLGWERAMTTMLQRLARGERPTAEGDDYSDTDATNARFTSEFAPIGANTVLAAWSQRHMVFVKAAQAVPGDRFGEDNGKPKTANRLVGAGGAEHYREHMGQIKAWREKEGI